METLARQRRLNRRPRLDPSVYGVSGHAIHLIICCHRKRPLFAQGCSLTGLAIRALHESAHEEGVALLCYCLMPDHLHVVVWPNQPSSDALRFAKRLKTAVSREAGGLIDTPVWQRGTYDQVIRGNESLRQVCEYILDNPIRRGLVDRREDYPYSWISDEV